MAFKIDALNMSELKDLDHGEIPVATTMQELIANITTGQLRNLFKKSNVAYPQFAGIATLLAGILGERMLQDQNVERDSLAVITVGETLHVPTAFDFASKGLQRGSVNVLQFSRVLPNACAATVAAALGAHGPAFSVGARKNPLREACVAANDLVAGSIAEACLLLCTVSQDWPPSPSKSAYMGPTASGAIGILLLSSENILLTSQGDSIALSGVPNDHAFQEAARLWFDIRGTL